MPLTLDSTAPLVGRKPKRKWTLVVMGHGRWPYLRQTLEGLRDGLIWSQCQRAVICLDGIASKDDIYVNNGIPVRYYADASPVEFLFTGPKRRGLTANLTQAWGALTEEDEWVFFVEEDFLVHDAPIEAMADILEANPTVCQMALIRQPWSPEEAHAGGLLWGPHFKGDFNYRGGWMEHRRIFTLNPFVAHAEFLRSLRPSVESDLTQQCLERGLSFGMWGAPTDPPRVEHIGAEGGMGSRGWRA